VNGARSEFSVKRSIEPIEWDTGKGRSSKKTKKASSLNEYLDEVWTRIQEIRKELEHENQEVTAISIAERYLGKQLRKKKVLELYQEHNDRLQERMGKDVAKGTWDRHKTSKKHFQEFLKQEFQCSDMEAHLVTKRTLEGYNHYLLTNRNCGNNTARKYLMNLSKILNMAVEEGYMDRNPYPLLKLRKTEVETDFLTDQELDRIRTKEFSTCRLGEVRDAFVFCCLTGLAFTDVKTLQPQHLVNTQDQEWIIKPRNKTKVSSRIPLLPAARKILDQYSGIAQSTGYLLPVRSNQRMNEYLKEIATLCEVDKTLTTHVARHTFATTVTLLNDVSIESVSKMLGHTNLAMTQKYARILDQKINGEMLANVAAKY
jgi:site-specific recombinase XerD